MRTVAHPTYSGGSGENIKDDRYRIPQYEVEVDDGDVYVTV